ncbi:MAG: sigma-70 family RNA polymerase sigma factor [Planctomycetota bacterium]
MSTRDPSTDHFLQSPRAGDEQAVAELVAEYWAPSYRLALRFCGGDAAAAEDVAQEALIDVLRGVQGLAPGRPFRPWVFRVVSNAAREHLRKASRRARHEGRAPAAASRGEPVEGAASRGEEVAALRRGLDALPEPFREALSLRFLEGLSLREVAEVMGCREGTASSRVRRGLEALRRSVGPVLAGGVALAALLPEVARAEEVPPPPAPAALLRAAVSRGPLARDPGASGAGAVGALAALGALLAVGLLAGGLYPGPRSGPQVARGAPTSPARGREEGDPARSPRERGDPARGRTDPATSPRGRDPLTQEVPATPPRDEPRLPPTQPDPAASPRDGQPRTPTQPDPAPAPRNEHSLAPAQPDPAPTPRDEHSPAPGEPDPTVSPREEPRTPTAPKPGAKVRAIDAMVLAVGKDEVRLSVGEDDGVRVGMRFRILRGQREVGTVTCARALRDSCVCRVATTAPGEAIAAGDGASTP